MTGRNIVTAFRRFDGGGAYCWLVSYDLTTLMHNLAIAGALAQAYADGRSAGVDDGAYLQSYFGAAP